MNPLFLLRDCVLRAFERKWAPVCLLILFLVSTICGLAFIKTPSFYEYHLKVCDRFLDRVCYSDRSVFLIFLERTTGNALMLGLLVFSGVHPAGLVLATTVIAFRGYLFGGTLAILFTVYGASGVFVALVLFLPVHLLLDAVFLLAGSCSFCRAFRFRFCMSDFRDLLFETLPLLALIVIICIFEGILLLVLFHPVGNLL